MSFVNLHAHSHYSLLDGFGSPKTMVLRSKKLGYPACALTDHGVTHGLIELFQYSKAEGIKPILGCELYVARRTRFDKDSKLDTKPYHLTVLAKNNVGYQNLLKLVTKANLEGFYYKPRVDYGLLKAYSEGLIALSGCLAAHIPRLIVEGDENELRRVTEQYIDIFGHENFYFEMQDHQFIEEQTVVNKRLKEMSKEYGIGLVVTNDSHYACPEDNDVHDIMLCIQTGTEINDPNRMRYTGDFSIRDINELKLAFSDTPEAFDNVLKIADSCDYTFEFGKNLIPSFQCPQNEDPEKYLRTLSEEGLVKRFEPNPVPEEYKQRLEYELSMVHKMGFDTYFLIVQDFVSYAKSKKIVVGPGRGSAAGSLMSWSLNITNVDPLKYGLFFERFLNPERVSMPDIDIDFADTRRQEVIEYVVAKYGRENVAQIITFGTMAPKAAVRDVGRALGYPYSEVVKLSNIIPGPVLGKHTPLVKSIKDDPQVKHEYDTNPRAKVLLDYAKRLEGSVRHTGTHACAVIISEKPLTNYTALQYGAGSKEEIVTQYSAKPLEELGLLKMDFLGLKNLTMIEMTANILKRTQKIDLNIDNIPLDDDKTFELFRRGETTGVFQFESTGMRRYLKELQPNRFDDLVAMAALYRPGPMEWIPDYIKGKHNPSIIKYMHDSFEHILGSTYGVAVYQEQVLQIARDFSGFSLGEADVLRKAVGKKIPELLAKQKEKFIEGAVKQGHDKKLAEEIFTKAVEPFAGYGFNKSHAVCYALIAYQTAYLKANYPIEFMTSILCVDAANTERVVLEIKECTDLGFKILPPSINQSLTNFTVIDQQTIRFGLMAVKGIGEGPVTEIIEERKKNGVFKSLEDFANRIQPKLINKKLIQSLAYAGAFDEFGDRNQVAESYEEISGFAKNSQIACQNNQTSIFGIMEEADQGDYKLKLKRVQKLSFLTSLKLEKDYLGLFVSGHLLEGLKNYIHSKANLISSLNKKHIGKNIKLVGLVSEYKQFVTKNGAMLSSFVLEDPTGKIHGVIFSNVLKALNQPLGDDMLLFLSGKFDYRRDQFQLVVDTVKILSLETMIENAKESNLYEPNTHDHYSSKFIDDILADYVAEMKAKENESNDVLPFNKAKSENEIITIEIPVNTSVDVLKNISQLLKNNPGNSEVQLFLKDSDKTLKLPFKINYSDDLKLNLASLLK